MLNRQVSLSTVLKALLVVIVLTTLYRGYAWRENVNTRGWHSDQTFGYLSNAYVKGPDDKIYNRSELIELLVKNAWLKGPDGKIYTKADVLDAVLQNFLRQAVQAQQQKAQPQLPPVPPKK